MSSSCCKSGFYSIHSQSEAKQRVPFRVVDDAWKELMYSLKQERTKLSQANPLAKKPPTPLPLVLSFVGPDKKFKGVAAVQRSQLVRAVNCTSLFPAVAAETLHVACRSCLTGANTTGSASSRRRVRSLFATSLLVRTSSLAFDWHLSQASRRWVGRNAEKHRVNAIHIHSSYRHLPWQR